MMRRRLSEAYRRALAYLTGLPNRPVGAEAGASELRAALGERLPELAADPSEVVRGGPTRRRRVL
jgi:hypothetical protein